MLGNFHMAGTTKDYDVFVMDEDYRGIPAWRTLQLCPKCHSHIVTNGSERWCDICGYQVSMTKEEKETTVIRDWTEEEDRFIIDNYVQMDTRDIADILNRTRPQITSRVSQLRAKGYAIAGKARSGGGKARSGGRRVRN